MLTIGLGLFFCARANCDIIGADNRIEASQLTGVHRTRAESVVTMIKRRNSSIQADGSFSFDANFTYKNDRNICPGQRFSDQNTPAEIICGGSLIAPDLVMTARHCIADGSNCATDFSFVFGYIDQRSSFPPSDHYHCKELLWKNNDDGVDVALIKLDRPVTGRQPLPLRRRGTATEGESVTLIGPHAKLSLKSSSGVVKYVSNDPNDRQAAGTNLDCFSNDSGSPVFNPRGSIEGVFFAFGNLTPPGQSTVTELAAARPTPTTVSQPVTNTPPSTAAVDSKAALINSSAPITEPRCINWETEIDQPRNSYRPDGAPCMINGDCNVGPVARGCTFTPTSYFINDIQGYIDASNREHSTRTTTPLLQQGVQ